MEREIYFQRPGSGPACSTARSAKVRQRRFDMGYEERSEPEEYARLAEEARRVLVAKETEDPALARAAALRYVVENCPLVIEEDDLFLGGADPLRAGGSGARGR